MDPIDITRFSDHQQLEALGKSLHTVQFLELLHDYPQWSTSQQWKLAPIIIGIAHDRFVEALMEAAPIELNVLKHESLLEPVQHHLTMLSHQLLQAMQELDDEIVLFENVISTLDTLRMGRAELLPFWQRMSKLAEQLHVLIGKVDRCLILAWHTDRPDLIDQVSGIKEHCQKLVIEAVGMPRTVSMGPSGLYARFEERLHEIYDQHDNVPGSLPALKDTDPAIEGLARLSIWYPQDYLAMGLLVPSLDKTASIEQQRQAMNVIKAQLEEKGLCTIVDLKRAGIFSKKSLQEYLQDQFPK